MKFPEIEGIDHPILFYLLFVLGGINALDIITTKVALMNTANIEGNPLMAPVLQFAPYIKFMYILGIYMVSDYLEHRNKNRGVILLAVSCMISFIIVSNNILVLNGYYIFG